MNQRQLFLGIAFFILLCMIVSVRLGLVVSCIFFATFLFFFINKNMNNRTYIENYEPTYLGKMKTDNAVKYQEIPKSCYSTNDTYKAYADPFQRKPKVVERNMTTLNGQLQGGQNPKTLIPPMVTRPMYDMSWRKNNLVVPNKINGQSNEAIGKSGFLTDNYASFSEISQRQLQEASDTVENFEINYDTAGWDNSVLAPNGYDRKQFETNSYPANLPSGPCAQNKNLESHNKTLFTTPIQPGVYYSNQVAEPINSNIGISFQQQFLPRTYSAKDGNVRIVDHDPSFAPYPTDVIEMPEEPKPENVYDPRFTGYGTSYRNYLDPVTGQTRFPYDDVNAIRMPNYLVRSKIDTHNFSDTYGPMQQRGLSLNETRQRAQDAFLQDTTNFRDDMMSRLMRKRNAEMWQVKQFPKTGAGRMMHG